MFSAAQRRTTTTTTLRQCLLAEALSAPLLPFLYSTKTIVDTKLGKRDAEEQELQAIKERWSSPRTRTGREPSAGRRDESAAQQMRTARQKKRASHVPFEGSTGSMNPAERFQNTTMTPREMHVFEELFRKGIERPSVDAAAKTSTRHLTEREFPELLRPLAEEAKQLREQATRAAATDDTAESNLAQQTEIQDEQSKETQKLMDDAETDIALWRVAQDHVLVRLKDIPTNVAVQENYTALPALLLHYMHLISNRYPVSPFGLMLLPHLKKIGPLAFALGATTELYNQHLRLLWRQYSDVDGINKILSEMDAEIYPFNEATRDIIADIFEHVNNARVGELGPALEAIWAMDRRKRAVATLKKWRQIVDERLDTQAIREAQLRNFESLQAREEAMEETGEQLVHRPEL